jgi:hypothetical protein
MSQTEPTMSRPSLPVITEVGAPIISQANR